MAQRWRLIPYLLFAGLFHVLILFILPAPFFSRLAPDLTLEVRLATPPRQPEDTPLPKPGPKAENAKTLSKIERIPPSFQLPPPLEHADILGRPVESSSAPPRISLESLLDSAKGIARDEAKRTPQTKRDGIGIEDRPVLPGLAKMLSRNPVSETLLPNGIYKVVTESGTVYCLIPLPVIATSGLPVKPTIVPSSCP